MNQKMLNPAGGIISTKKSVGPYTKVRIVTAAKKRGHRAVSL